MILLKNGWNLFRCLSWESTGKILEQLDKTDLWSSIYSEPTNQSLSFHCSQTATTAVFLLEGISVTSACSAGVCRKKLVPELDWQRRLVIMFVPFSSGQTVSLDPIEQNNNEKGNCLRLDLSNTDEPNVHSAAFKVQSRCLMDPQRSQDDWANLFSVPFEVVLSTLKQKEKKRGGGIARVLLTAEMCSSRFIQLKAPALVPPSGGVCVGGRHVPPPQREGWKKTHSPMFSSKWATLSFFSSSSPSSPRCLIWVCVCPSGPTLEINPSSWF